MADMFKLKTFECDIEKVLKKRGLDNGGQVQKFIDTECLKLCAPFVPKDNNILIDSGDKSKIGSGQLEYNTPYARRWYYMPANFQEGSGSGMETEGRGNYWFERMKQDYKDQILKDAQKIARGDS